MSLPPDEPWLIPVRFDECDIPDLDFGGGRPLASIQRADLFGEHSDEGATRLVAAILRLLGRGPATAAASAIPERRPAWINALCPITVADDQWLASAESDGIVRMWDPATGKLRRTLEAANWRGVTRLPAIVRT